MSSRVLRRNFLRGFVVTVAASQLPGCGDDGAPGPPDPSTDPEDQDRVFPQGLASGDPSPSSVMLWVRVEPEDETGPIAVHFEVATDDAFGSIVAEGDADVVADADHTLRVKVTELDPYTTYFYRFTARNVQSIAGRTKTAPADDADVSPRFAFAACQDFIGRYYHAWKALAAEPEVDFVLYLGDYIYETNGDPDFQTSGSDRAITIPDGVQLLEDDPNVKGARTLGDYRGIYKQYRRDADLRKIHSLYPFIAIWDDHEFANDAWQDHATDFNEAQGDEKSPERRHAASQAWFEYQPADVEFDAAASPPSDIRIYRTLRYGKHVELFLTDQRSYRSDHVIPEGAAPTDRPAGAPDTVPTYGEAGKSALFPNSEVFTRNFVIKEGFDPIEAYVKPTMLGAEQKTWLVDAITSSAATWKIWGNQTQLVQMLIDIREFDIPDMFKGIYYFTVDQWDGYRTERKEILTALQGVSNLVALTGDIHAFYAAEVHLDPDDLTDAPTLVEYVTAGISSSPVQEITQGVVDSSAGFAPLAPLVPQFDQILTATSPEYKYASSNMHGVSIIEVDGASEIRVTFLQVADVKTKDFDGNVSKKSFRTVAGQNKVEAL
ncbi:MAG: alkaline phosphatase [Polyangiaceae bacterium]|nr:alkaline phosphatase [Polyangiaceae bacterium]